MAAMRTVFMHGAGKSGRSAWPVQAQAGSADWVFMDRASGVDLPESDATRIVAALGSAANVVGASYGGLAAMLAAEAAEGRIRALVLCEPACFSLARGRPAVEAHVSAMAPVFARADDPRVTHLQLSQLFAKAMGTPVPDLPPDVLNATVSRLRETIPPWEVTVSELLPQQIPTLVLTGNSEPMYLEVAQALASLGAEHIPVPGAGHRPQDHPGGIEAMQQFWRGM
jgi:pimeloyl-ACP methyl ester carboxylesterase